MSFFYDFLEYFSIADLNTKTTVTMIVGVGAMIMGNLRLSDIQENSITFVSNKDKIFIIGEELKIKSISKGEVVIAGNIKKVETEDL